MSRKTAIKAQQITVDEIATVAATGVTRALAARQAAGMELSSEELSHVDGGATSLTSSFPVGVGPIVAGGIIDELYGVRVPSRDLAPLQNSLR